MSSKLKKDITLTGIDKEAANELSSLFTSLFVKEGETDGPDIDFVGISKPTNSMLDFNISDNDVCKKQLKDDKSLGPDGIQPLVLKKMAEIVALPLKLILNSSMLSNKLPLEWKGANISPIFMKGSKSELGNCRSLTAIPCKIMESITGDKMEQPP